VTSRSATAQRLRDLAWLRRVRDRIDREYAQPLDIGALARGVHLSAGHLSRQFRATDGESPYSYLMTRRIERAMALLRRGDLSVTEVCFGRLCVAGQLQQSLHRAGRGAAQRLPAPGGTGDGGAAVVDGQPGDQTSQESRSARPRAAPSLTWRSPSREHDRHGSHHSLELPPHDDPEACLAFYRDILGFEVRNDVGHGGLRWITLGPADQPEARLSIEVSTR
jgi:hypothetical protein